MSSDKNSYLKIIDQIDSFSKGNYDSKIELSGTNSELDTIASQLNKLGEELSLSKQELISQQFFISSILDNIPADIAVFDKEHNYLFVNERAVSNKEIRSWLIGKNDFDYCKFKNVDDAIAHKRRRFFNKAAKTKSAIEWVDEHTSKEGKLKYVLRKFHPVFENDQLKYVIGYGIDISELKTAETEKTKLIDELNHKYNDLMQFNYIVSHNLRGPVASIIGLSDVINMPTINTEEKLKVIEHIRISALRMDDLLKDLSVLLSRGSTLNMQKENVNIASLVHSITDTLSTQISQSKSTIKTEITGDASSICTIKSYLESILYNLISNAIKYKSPDRIPEIFIKTKKSEDDLILTIEDNGIGIDLEKHGQYVFGLYKRFNLETEGKGLGLHMTKTQVETLGGHISIESEPEKGTKFIIVLPLSSNSNF